jgi:hypothetical protein
MGINDEHPVTKQQVEQAFNTVAQAVAYVVGNWADHQKIQQSLGVIAHALSSLKFEEPAPVAEEAPKE